MVHLTVQHVLVWGESITAWLLAEVVYLLVAALCCLSVPGVY